MSLANTFNSMIAIGACLPLFAVVPVLAWLFAKHSFNPNRNIKK